MAIFPNSSKQFGRHASSTPWIRFSDRCGVAAENLEYTKWASIQCRSTRFPFGRSGTVPPGVAQDTPAWFESPVYLWQPHALKEVARINPLPFRRKIFLMKEEEHISGQTLSCHQHSVFFSLFLRKRKIYRAETEITPKFYSNISKHILPFILFLSLESRWGKGTRPKPQPSRDDAEGKHRKHRRRVDREINHVDVLLAWPRPGRSTSTEIRCRLVQNRWGEGGVLSEQI